MRHKVIAADESPRVHGKNWLDKQETKRFKQGEANWNKGGEIDQFGEKALANELNRLLKPRDEVDRMRMEKAIDRAFFDEMGIGGKNGARAGTTGGGVIGSAGTTPGVTPGQTPDSVNVAPGTNKGQKGGGTNQGNNGGNNQGANQQTDGDLQIVEPSANARAQNFRKHFQQFIRPFQGLWAELEGGM